MRPSLPFLSTQFKLAETVTVLAGAAFVQVLKPNPNRYAIVFCSVSGGQINLARILNGPASGSLTLANAANASVQAIILSWAEVGALVSSDWYAVANIPPQTLGIQEIMYWPTGEVPA